MAKKDFSIKILRKRKEVAASDKSLVCSLHFTEGDHKTGKLRILLPSAIPAVLLNYPHYMEEEIEQTKRKRPQNTPTTEGVMAEWGGTEYSTNIRQPHLFSQSYQPQATAPEPSMTASFEIVFIADEAWQTTFALAHIMAETKKTEPRLKMKVAPQKNALQILPSENDEVRERLQGYDKNKQIQEVIQFF